MRVIQEITNEKISRRIDEFEARMRRERKETKMLNFDKYREAIISATSRLCGELKIVEIVSVPSA